VSAYNNIVILKGNIGKTPEMAETTAGHVAKFSLAVYRSGKGEKVITDWINCVAWHELALGVANLNKGTRIIVIGSIATRSYEKEGVKKYITELQARDIGLDVAVKGGKEDKELSDNYQDEEAPF
jgi:single-strand DNA-binding protein